MKKTELSSLHKERGFTIVELMIASTLGLIVIAVVGSLFMNTRKLNDIGMARIAVQQDLRTAGTMITRDARMAGSFGCLSLGRLYGPDTDETVSKDFGITYGNTGNGKNPLQGIAQLGVNPAGVGGGAFGVRWIKKDDMLTNTDIPAVKDKKFIPQSGALLFYYGSGTTGIKTVSTGNIKFEDTSPNQIVKNTVDNGGYVILASCLAANIQSAKTISNMSFDIPNLLQDPSTVVNPPQVNQQQVREISLMRYMVIAYMVGDVAGEPTSLYRFELQDNGQWGPPELLARNVSAMTADYVFIPDCPSAAAPASEVNKYDFVVRSADQGDTVKNTSGNPRPPVAVDLTLTYNYPKAFGQDTAATMQGNTFRIDATIRGGNLCAERRLTTIAP